MVYSIGYFMCVYTGQLINLYTLNMSDFLYINSSIKQFKDVLATCTCFFLINNYSQKEGSLRLVITEQAFLLLSNISKYLLVSVGNTNTITFLYFFHKEPYQKQIPPSDCVSTAPCSSGPCSTLHRTHKQAHPLSCSKMEQWEGTLISVSLSLLLISFHETPLPCDRSKMERLCSYSLNAHHCSLCSLEV